MRKLLGAAISLVFATGLGVATASAAAPQAASPTSFTCLHFQDPTVELVWSHVCHF